MHSCAVTVDGTAALPTLRMEGPYRRFGDPIAPALPRGAVAAGPRFGAPTPGSAPAGLPAARCKAMRHAGRRLSDPTSEHGGPALRLEGAHDPARHRIKGMEVPSR